MHLRTQKKNMERTPPEAWSSPGPRADRRRFQYRLERRGEPVLQEIQRNVGWPSGQRFRFDLPDFGPPPISGYIAVLRPVTVRTEWANFARNPLPEYIAEAAQVLRESGFTVVVIADIDGTVERNYGALPQGDHSLVHGELRLPEIMALMQHAAVIVGGPGFIVPAGIALRVPLVVIGGGNGGHNSPSTLTERRMDTSRVRWVLPDDYCMCRSMTHSCPKTISDFAGRFRRAVSEVAC